jgi:hypothetical protein
MCRHIIGISSIISIYPFPVSSTIEHLKLFKVLVNQILQIHPIVITDVIEECYYVPHVAVLERSTLILLASIVAISTCFS